MSPCVYRWNKLKCWAGVFNQAGVTAGVPEGSALSFLSFPLEEINIKTVKYDNTYVSWTNRLHVAVSLRLSVSSGLMVTSSDPADQWLHSASVSFISIRHHIDCLDNDTIFADIAQSLWYSFKSVLRPIKLYLSHRKLPTLLFSAFLAVKNITTRE